MGDPRVIIVGAGIGGLSAGHWLTQRGYEVEIVEASDRPGGRMRSLERKDDRIDVGAQFFHSNYRRTLGLLHAMDMDGARRTIRGKVQFMLEDGSPYLYDHRTPYMRVLGLRGNLKLYWFVLRYIVLGRRFPLYEIAKDIPEYDDVEVLDLFRATSDKPLRDFLVTTVGMEPPENVSLYHFIHTFRFGAFTSFIALRDGIASLPVELARRLPVRYEAPVRRLVAERGRVVGVQMDGDGSVRRAGHVIVAIDPPSASRIMPDELEEQRRFLESVPHVPFPMPVFFLDRPLRRDVWAYFNYPGLKRTFMFAVDQHAKAPETIRSGKSVLNAWLGYAATPRLIERNDEDILRIAQEDIELMVPGFSQWIHDAMVVRHPYHVAEYPLGMYGRVLAFQEQARQLRGVSFVSDLFGGSYIEGATVSARAAADRVCAAG